jgi:hypothetical protein
VPGEPFRLIFGLAAQNLDRKRVAVRSQAHGLVSVFFAHTAIVARSTAAVKSRITSSSGKSLVYSRDGRRQPARPDPLSKESPNLTIPLILQIQQAALDSNSSVTDALRKAKLACTKLGLSEFGNWVDLELNGYMEEPAKELPKYRKLRGTPEAYNPYHGWEPIIFQDAKAATSFSLAPVGMSMAAIEKSLEGTANGSGSFEFPYPTALAAKIRKAIKFDTATHIKLTVSQVADIPHTVRNILLEWTIDMENQGILGTDLTFNEEERAKSEAATAHTVNNINIGQVGAFVQGAENSVIQGGDDAVLNLDGVHQLVKQVEQLLSVADLPNSVKENTEIALAEIKQAADSSVPDRGRLRRALEGLKRVVAPAGEHLLRIGVDAAVTKLLGGG